MTMAAGATAAGTAEGDGWHVKVATKARGVALGVDAAASTLAVESPTSDEKKEDAAAHAGSLSAEIVSKRLDEARTLFEDDKLLLAAHSLRGIDERAMRSVHLEILREAKAFERVLRDSTAPVAGEGEGDGDGGWTKQGEHSGRHNFCIYYKLGDPPSRGGGGGTGGQELSCRLETALHSDMLVPILSVLNESELYATVRTVSSH